MGWPGSTVDEGTGMGTDAEQLAKARALSSPIRLRILRMCLHEPHTNREIAQALDLNPGTCLHHVRTLVAVGFLEAGEPRTGRRGAREVPYLSTRRSWQARVPGLAPVVIETFLQEIENVPARDIVVARMGVRANAATEAELMAKLTAVLEEYKDVEDDDGRPLSLLLAVHPEVNRPYDAVHSDTEGEPDSGDAAEGVPLP